MIMKYLSHEVNKRKIVFGFPLLNVKKIPFTKSKKDKDMITLLDFIK